jgi:hypothetical protein
MSKNPFLNALVASGYIGFIVTLIFNSPNFIKDSELGMMAPILFLSLFVFSAALMGYLFLYQPMRLLFENKQAEATKLFLTTIFAFACVTVVIFLAWLLLSTLLS